MVATGMTATLHEAQGSYINAKFALTLHYDPADPMAVKMTCHNVTGTRDEDGDVVWLFALILLSEGVSSKAYVGEADVKVRYLQPSDIVLLTLENQDGKAVLSLPGQRVRLFLDRVNSVIPDQKQISDMLDESLAKILEDDA